MSIVQAQGEQPPKPWTNSTTEFRPDIGLLDPNSEPGVNGYKIFNPGAISTFAVKGQGKMSNAALVSGVRRAATDASTNLGSGVGDHDSESPLFEDDIWVDGCIKRTSSSAWADCDSNRTSGHIAHADTYVSGAYGTQYTAKSWHKFHKSGYIDWNPTTSDSVKS
jgi:hypothetical protein